MAWYTSTDNCIDTLPLPSSWMDLIVEGQEPVEQRISSQLIADVNRLERPCLLALDGYKEAPFGTAAQWHMQDSGGGGNRSTAVQRQFCFPLQCRNRRYSSRE